MLFALAPGRADVGPDLSERLHPALHALQDAGDDVLAEVVGVDGGQALVLLGPGGDELVELGAVRVVNLGGWIGLLASSVDASVLLEEVDEAVAQVEEDVRAGYARVAQLYAIMTGAGLWFPYLAPPLWEAP